MDRASLYELLKRERSASDEEKALIDQMSERYPYFHALHTLRCAIKYQDSYGARDRMAAIRVMAGALPRPIAVLDMVNGHDVLSVARELAAYQQRQMAEEREKAEALEREQQMQEAQKRQEAIKRLEEEQARQRREEERKRQEEEKRLEEQRREEEARKKREAQRRLEELKAQKEKERREEEERKRQEELKAKQEKERQEEEERKRLEELKAKQEKERQEEEERKRQEELKAKQEKERQEEEERKRQEELKAKQEKERQEEEERKRQEELKAKQEKEKGEEVDGVIVIPPSEKGTTGEEEMVVRLNVSAEPFKFIYESEPPASHGPQVPSQQGLNLLPRAMAEEGVDIMPTGVFILDPVKQEMANENMEFVRTVLNPNYRPPEQGPGRSQDPVQDRLIDTFIATSEEVIRKILEAEQRGEDGGQAPVDLSAKSAGLDSDIASETLARVYASKGLYQEAEAMYRTLMRKYPEKNAYFAELIESLPTKH